MVDSTSRPVKWKYGKGRRFEYQVRDFFTRKGFYVTRSAKSSFPDLIVIGPLETFFVECKNTKNIPKNPISLLSKSEYRRALTMVQVFGRPFYLFFKRKHKIDAVTIGGSGVLRLYALLEEDKNGDRKEV